MGMCAETNPFGGPTPLIEKWIGPAYENIKTIAENLDQLSPIATAITNSAALWNAAVAVETTRAEAVEATLTAGLAAQVTANIANAPAVATIAALRATTTTTLTQAQCYVMGYTASGDGGEGMFYYSVAHLGTSDNGGTVIVDASGRSWFRVAVNTAYSARWFGATGNDGTDDTAAIRATNNAAVTAGVGMTLPAGNYILNSSLTLTAFVSFQMGAKLTIASGQSVAFNGGLFSEVQQIFAGAGSGGVTVNGAVTSLGFPEWWGAVPNNPSFDCTNAINACIATMLITELQPVKYYTASTVFMLTSGRTVRGASLANPSGSASASYIICTSATAIAVQIGPSSQPGTLTQSNCSFQYIAVGRSVAPDMSGTPTGILVQYTIWTTLVGVWSYDHRYGYQVRGTGNSRLNFCSSSRYTPGINGTDQFYGIFVDCNANIGFSGGNASLYIEDCVVGSAIVLADSQGVVAAGTYGYSDLYIDKLETDALNIGITLVGNGNSSGTVDYKNADVRISDCVLDTCRITGIQFSNTSLYGAIRVTGGYIGFDPAGSSPVGITYSNSLGSVSVTGVQILCGNNASAKGVASVNSRGILHYGNVVYESASATGVYNLTSTGNSRFEDQIRNYQAAPNNPAFQVLGGSSQNFIRMNIEGRAAAFSVGYYIDNTCIHNEFACTGVNASCLSVSNGKMDNNGTLITAAYSTFGTGNLVSGIMA